MAPILGGLLALIAGAAMVGGAKAGQNIRDKEDLNRLTKGYDKARNEMAALGYDLPLQSYLKKELGTNWYEEYTGIVDRLDGKRFF